VLLDYSHNHLEDARDHWGVDKFIYVAADIYHLPFTPAQFDTAVMIRTLHHMDDPLAAIKQVRLILRQHGSYIVEYTNKRSLKTISKWLLKRGDYPFSQGPAKFDELYYGFHPDFVDNNLKEAGFAPQKRLAASYFRVKLLKRYIPTRILVGMDALLRGTGRIEVLSPSIFVKSEAVSPDTGEKGSSMWRCPSCCVMDTLEETPDALICSNCGNHYEIKDGIYDFRAAAKSSRHVQVDTTTGWGYGH
jgi:SAM-dependent methyltransferase